MSGKREGLVNAAPYGSPVTKHQSCRKYKMFSFSASLIFTGIVKPNKPAPGTSVKQKAACYLPPHF